MERGEGHFGQESRETLQTHWEHPCTSCHLEGSTSFQEDGTPQKMDVYSCSDHFQPGIYGMDGENREGQFLVVRYGEPTRDSKGEISFKKDTLDIETLKTRARNRQGKNDYTPAQIAIGKVFNK